MELEQRIKLIKKHQDTLNTPEKKEIFPTSNKKKAVIGENSPIIQRLREDEERAKLRHLSDDELIEREFKEEADALRANLADDIQSIKEYMEHNQTPQSRNFSSDLAHLRNDDSAENFGLNIVESAQDLEVAMPKSQRLERIPLPKRELDSANLAESAQILADSQNLAQDFSNPQNPPPTSQNQAPQNQSPQISQIKTPPVPPKVDLSNLHIQDSQIQDFAPDFKQDSAPNTTPNIISNLASQQNSNEIVGIYTPHASDSAQKIAESSAESTLHFERDFIPNPPIYAPNFEYNFDDGRTHRIEIVDKIDNYDIEFPKIKALYNDILGDNNIIDTTDDIDELNEINHSLVRAQKKLEERLKVAKIRQQLGDIKSITPIYSNGTEFKVDLVRDSAVDSANFMPDSANRAIDSVNNVALDSAPTIALKTDNFSRNVKAEAMPNLVRDSAINAESQNLAPEIKLQNLAENSQNISQTSPQIAQEAQIQEPQIEEYGDDFFDLPQSASDFKQDSANSADSAEFVSDDFAESREFTQDFAKDEIVLDSATFPKPPHFSQNLTPNKAQESQNLAHIQSTNGEFQLPPLELLNQPFAQKIDIDDSEIDIKVQNLFNKLRVFKIEGDIVRTYSGPVVTTFEFRPAPNVKVSRIQNLQDDLSMALKATSIRIQAPIPGKDVVGIEIPNNKIQTIYLREVFESDEFRSANAHLPIALGKDVIGNPVIEDLAKLPHLLIAGTTGSGKSVGINAMILSLLYKHTPKELRFIMIDPKFLEFGLYKDIPHLLTPIITDPKKAIIALSKAVEEMNRRYELMDKAKVKTIVGFNELAMQNGEEKLPYIVIIIDEFADLMIMGGREAEQFLISLAGKARASGIHLIIATQRPTVNVVTGLIKGNLPSKISYRVGSKIDSKVILDETGAEALLGRGDMLFSKTNNIVRLHAPYNDEREIERIVEFLKSQQEVEYDEFFSLEAKEPSAMPQPTQISSEGDYKERAKEIIIQSGKTSISYLQRGLGVGFNKAASIIESLEKDGFLSPPNSKGVREIIGN